MNRYGSSAPSSIQIKSGLSQLVNCDIVAHSNHYALSSKKLAEYTAREMVRKDLLGIIAQAIHDSESDSRGDWRYWFWNQDRILRELRIALLLGNVRSFERFVDEYKKRSADPDHLGNPLHCICCVPMDARWLLSLKTEIFQICASYIIGYSISSFKNLHVSQLIELVRFREKKFQEKPPDFLCLNIARWYLLAGESKNAEQRVSEVKGAEASVLKTWLDHARRPEEPSEAFEPIARVMRDNTLFQGIEGPLCALMLLAGKSSAEQTMARALCTRGASNASRPMIRSVYGLIGLYCDVLRGQKLDTSRIKHLIEELSDSSVLWFSLFEGLVLHWLSDRADISLQARIDALASAAKGCGLCWIHDEAASLLCKLEVAEQQQGQQKLLEAKTETHTESRSVSKEGALVSLISPEYGWERTLKALALFGAGNLPAATSRGESEGRIAWIVDLESDGSIAKIEAREQKQCKDGNWSRGRSISRRRLGQLDTHIHASTKDIEIGRVLAEDDLIHAAISDGGYRPKKLRAMLILVGHPSVFRKGQARPIEVSRSEPQLSIRTLDDDLSEVTLHPTVGADAVAGDLRVIDEGDRLALHEFSEEHIRIGQLLGQGVVVPPSGRDLLVGSIQGLSPHLNIVSDIDGIETDVRSVKPDSRPHFLCSPLNEGIEIRLRVRPFETGGPCFAASEGPLIVVAKFGAESKQCTRDLKQEKQLAQQALEHCPGLIDLAIWDETIAITDPELSLEVLAELNALGKDAALEMLEGSRVSINRNLGIDDLSLKVTSGIDWFDLDGELKVDEGLSISLQALLEFEKNSRSRFIPVGPGQYLALTEQLRKKIQAINNVSEPSKDGTRMSKVASLSAPDVFEEISDVEIDKDFREHQAKIRKIGNREFKIPKALHAELRPYQREGYVWMARLASWQLGACLADDMGLGKTVQALAILLKFASGGPSLVVAPTSVVPNWISETNRFAPGMKIRELGSYSRKEREKVIRNLKKKDVLLCSYGLLLRESKILADKNWACVVMDEAQNIKNHQSKRSLAARKLKADFRLATTGTPIENNLSELWSLFRFLVPGLFGPLDKFFARFIAPIEKHQDAQVQEELRALVQPYILRRLKSEVLKDLPDRIESIRWVELKGDELALVESIRAESVNKLKAKQDKEELDPIQILAEISRLRRAVCNPRLVLKKSTIRSSKLDTITEILHEAREGGHRTLLFSQWVGHLRLIREILDREEWKYLYLDGSTPLKARKKTDRRFSDWRVRSVLYLAQGGRMWSESDCCRLCDSLRSVVESAGRSPGFRSSASHRPEQGREYLQGTCTR